MTEEKKFFKKNKINILVSILAGAVGAILINVFIVALIFANPKNIKGFLVDVFENFGVKNELAKVSKDKEAQKSNPVVEPPVDVKDFTNQESVVVETVKRSNPAVVSIVITKDVPIIERYYEDSPSNLDQFDDFFGDDFFGNLQFKIPQYRENGTEKKEIGGGSGFLVSSDGMIITNKHVVSNEDAEYAVFTNDGKKYEAKVVARDPINDVAVIKIEGANLQFLDFADSEKLEVGQSVIAIGNALGEFRNTVSVGVISGLSRSVVAGDGFGSSEQLDGVIQTDAAINRGNSGGPLLNLSGQVIGVNVAMAAGSENIGFALPANLVKNVVDSVKEFGKVIRPFLGVRYLMITDAIKDKNKLTVNYGALVVRGESREELAVMPGSAADKAGLEENDIILEVEGVKIEGDTTLSSVVRKKKVGDILKFKISHRGEEKEIDVVLEEMPD
ncbi:MAG: trypsin-like peptidase domain-containing protein [bacterium]